MRTFIAAMLIVLAPSAALAYVGPGAGLSLLGALWALIAAIGLAIAFVVAWPVRKMLRNRKKAAAGTRTAERREITAEQRPAGATAANPSSESLSKG